MASYLLLISPSPASADGVLIPLRAAYLDFVAAVHAAAADARLNELGRVLTAELRRAQQPK